LARSLSPPVVLTRRPGRPLPALAFSRSVQEPQTRLTPPPRRAPPGQQRGRPPGSSRRMKQDLRFRCHLNLFDASTTHTRPRTTGRALLERLPGPHLTGSSPAFSPNARHDGLQPTQHRGGLTPTPAGPTPEGHKASISRTAPLYGVLPSRPPPTFVTHASQVLQDRLTSHDRASRDYGLDLPRTTRPSITTGG
jgi:hypothetical protein